MLKISNQKKKNEELRKENKKLKKENEQLRKNKAVKDVEIKESIKKPKEMKSFEENKNTTDFYPNWFDRNKFEKILAIIDSNKFNYKDKIVTLKCKIGEFKYINIKHLVNNIRNNTISELSAKKSLNTLNEIKNAEIIKHKKRTPKQKELLNLFNNLSDTILTDKTLMSSKDEDKNEKEKKNENGNENDQTLMSSKDDDDENENEDDDET